MTGYHIHLDLEVSTEVDDDTFDAHTDAVLDELLELDGVYDADMSVAIAARTVTFSVCVDADSQPAALAAAFTAIRTAIHAEDGFTPGWEDALAQARADVTPASREVLAPA